MSGDGRGRGIRAKAVESLRVDVRIAARHLVVNAVGGAVWMPRAGRVLVYRLAGIRALGANLLPGSRFTGTDVVIGDGTYVNSECYFDVGRGRLRIGRDCNLGPQVGVFGMTHDLCDDGTYDRRSRHAPVTIGDGVWIGARASILPGVTVGDGCIVAAGAVVTVDCEPRGLYAGVPARRVRDLAPGERPRPTA